MGKNERIQQQVKTDSGLSVKPCWVQHVLVDHGKAKRRVKNPKVLCPAKHYGTIEAAAKKLGII
jgi:hypothetical protein